MSNRVSPPDSRSAERVPWSADLAVVAAAVVCALILWLFTVRLAGVELTVSSAGGVQHIGAAAVGISAGVSALVGLLGLRLLERLTPKALAVTIVSMLGPLSATTAPAKGTLVGLHAVVAVVVIVAAHRSRLWCPPARLTQ